MTLKIKNMAADKPQYLIGIGASAGGLEALQMLLAQIGDSLAQSAMIVAQHLSPQHKSSLAQLLEPGLSMQVREARHGLKLEPNTLYITPEDREISVAHDHIHLRQATQTHLPKPSIDSLFHSLARDRGESAIGVILSGNGRDGAAGLASIHRAGGSTLAQEPETTDFPSMPQAAIALGCVDWVQSPEGLGQTLRTLLEQSPEDRPTSQLGFSDAKVEEVFQRLAAYTGTDFLNYKPSTLCRRLEKRLTLLALPDPEAYLSYLDSRPEELEQLFRTVIIGVTGFFRDPDAFRSLSAHLLELLETKRPGDMLRIWIPGCATGEEAYTIAILLYEQLSDQWLNAPLQIFATDLDEQAINSARKGVFSRAAVEGLSPEQLSNCFVEHGDSYEVIKPIRSRILFTKHDVTANPPFLKLDLISCRNLLIYFNPQLQKQLLPIFHYALNPGGALFLGKSESINEFGDLFEAIDAESKLFRRKRGNSLRSIHLSAFRPHRQSSLELNGLRRKHAFSLSELVKETLFASFEHPYVVINESLDVQEISGDVRLYLGLSEGQIKPSILRLIHPELQLELMSTLTRALRENSAVGSEVCRFTFFGHVHHVRFSVKPLLFTQKGQDLYLLVFEAIARPELESGVKEPHAPTQALEHELAALKNQMQNYIEELETSNEELQSLNEELQSTNEELQSSNEELETSNEELQSTYEEVQVAYAELQATNHLLEVNRRQLREADTHMRALVNNTLQAFLLLDPQGKLMLFNDQADRLIYRVSGTRLKIGQPFVDKLRNEFQPLFESQFAQVLRGETMRGEHSLTDLEGQACHLAYNYTLALDADTGLKAVSLSMLDITDRVYAQHELRAQDLRFRSLIENSYDGIAILDTKGRYIYLSPSVERLLGYTPAELQGQLMSDFVHPDHVESLSRRHAQTAGRPGASSQGQWRQRHADGEWHWFEGTCLNMSQLPEIGGIIVNFLDITERKQHEDALFLSQARLRQVIDLIPAYIYARDAEGRYLLANALTARTFRRLPDEVEGQLHHELSPKAAFSPESLEADREVVQTGNIKLLPEELLLLESGKSQILRTYKIPYVSSDTGAPAALTVSLDITELKHSEASLRKSKANLRTILESGKTSFLLLDQNLRIVTLNEHAKVWIQTELGILPSEGMLLTELLAPERREAFETMTRGVLAGEGISYETSYPQPDGSHHWYNIRLDPVENRASGGVIGICYAVTDITERRRAEQRLRDNETHLLASQQIAHIGSWELDLSHLDDINVNPLRWTDECFRIFGYQPGAVEVSNELFFQHVHPDDREAIAATLSRAIETDGVYNIEHRIIRMDGQERIVYERGEILPDLHTGERSKMIGTVQDITEQRLVEQQIRKNEAHLLASQQIARVGSWEVSLQSQSLTDNETLWSDECYRILGFAPGSVTPSVALFNSLVPAEDYLLVQAALERTLNQGEVYSLEHRIVHTDGSEHVIYERADILRDSSGHPLKMLGTIQDITDRKQAESERNRLLVDLLQRNQALEQFSYIVSHNLRAPVANIRGCVDLLQHGPSIDAEQASGFDALAQSARHLDDIVLDLNRILHMRQGPPEPKSFVDFSKLLDELRSSLSESLAENKAKLTADFSQAPGIESYRGTLYGILFNLLSNSIRFREPERALEIQLKSEIQNGYLLLSVSDNGLGLDLERGGQQLFGLYKRFHPDIEGKGIGLFMAKAQAESIDAEISVSSTPGEGSCFQLMFKLSGSEFSEPADTDTKAD